MKRLRAGVLAALLPIGAGAVVFSEAPVASASVVIAVTFEALLRESTAAGIGTPVEQRSVWEDGRIYTYSRVHVERSVAGGVKKDEEVWVRTMGGVVGNIGQIVDGEPALTIGRPNLLFFHKGAPGTFEVTARAQGQFPVVAATERGLRLMRNSHVGVALPPKDLKLRGPVGLGILGTKGSALAADVLADRSLDDAVKEVADAWTRVHGK